MQFEVTLSSNQHVAFFPVGANARHVGECIYCGVTDEPLDKEHAVPYGLNGPWTLLCASCHACSNLTHRFERDTLRGLLSAVRPVLKMQSRTRKHRPRTLPLVVESRGIDKTIHVSLEDFPLYLPTPMMAPPGRITGAPLSLDVKADLQFIHVAGPSFEEVAKRLGADFVGARLTFSPHQFARTLAKIGYCAAVYALGVAPFRASPLRPVILGKDSNVGAFVGGWTFDPIDQPKGLHAMQVRASGSDVHVALRLFAQFGAPTYHVVVGEADPAFVASDDWPWK